MNRQLDDDHGAPRAAAHFITLPPTMWKGLVMPVSPW
jgi:hypothetical protein